MSLKIKYIFGSQKIHGLEVYSDVGFLYYT